MSEDYWRAATAAAALIAALGEVQRDGDASDRALVYQVTEHHSVFLESTGRLFDAIDRGDTTAALRIDADETDPAFDVMEAAVLDAAAGKHDRALVALQNLKSVTRVLTPIVFLAGLLLAGLLASITRGHRRLLVIERERAVHDAHHDALTGLPNRNPVRRARRAGARGACRYRRGGGVAAGRPRPVQGDQRHVRPSVR